MNRITQNRQCRHNLEHDCPQQKTKNDISRTFTNILFSSLSIVSISCSTFGRPIVAVLYYLTCHKVQPIGPVHRKSKINLRIVSYQATRKIKTIFCMHTRTTSPIAQHINPVCCFAICTMQKGQTILLHPPKPISTIPKNNQKTSQHHVENNLQPVIGDPLSHKIAYLQITRLKRRSHTDLAPASDCFSLPFKAVHTLKHALQLILTAFTGT